MDKFIGYSAEHGFVEIEQANEALAQHQCYIQDLIYIGYEQRFLQHLSKFTIVRLRT